MCILVSASDQATAAPEAPAPMMRTSTGSFITVPLGDDTDRQRTDAANEIRIEPRRRAHDLESQIALQDFLPEDADLLLGEAIADAAVDPGAKRKMLARLCAIDDELVGALDLVLVAIARDVPHHHLVALGDLAAAQFDIAARGAAHVKHRRLPADDFRHEAWDQLAARAHLLELSRVFHQRHEPTGHGIARGTIAANDQKPDRANEFARVEVPGGFRMRQHRDEVECWWSIDPSVPQFAEILGHLHHLAGALLFRMHDRIG